MGNKYNIIPSTQWNNRSTLELNNKRIAVIEHYLDSEKDKKELDKLIVTAVNNFKSLVASLALIMAMLYYLLIFKNFFYAIRNI
jgi:hypothetical protein